MIMAAICDDENNVCSAIEKMLFKAAMQLNLQIQTDVYYRVKDCASVLKQENIMI